MIPHMLVYFSLAAVHVKQICSSALIDLMFYEDKETGLQITTSVFAYFTYKLCIYHDRPVAQS